MICGTEKKNAKVCQNCGFDETKNFMHYSAAVPITSKIEENFQKDIRTAVEKSVSKQKAVLQKELTELQRQIAVAKTAKETAERESEENKLASKQKVVLQKELTELQRQIAVAKTVKETAERESEENKLASKQKAVLQKELTELQRQIAVAKTAKVETERENEKLKQLQTDVKTLAEQKSQMEQLIADKKKSYNKELDSWYSIYVQSSEEKTKLAQLKGSRETEEKAYNEIVKKRDEAQKEYDEIVKKRDDIQKEYNAMVQKRNAEEKKRNSLKLGIKTVVSILIIMLVCFGVGVVLSENWQQVNQVIEVLVTPYETIAEMESIQEMSMGQKIWNVTKGPICAIGVISVLTIMLCIVGELVDIFVESLTISRRMLKLISIMLSIMLITDTFLLWCFMIGWVSRTALVDITILGRASVILMAILSIVSLDDMLDFNICNGGTLSRIGLILGVAIGTFVLTEFVLPIGVSWIRDSATGDVLISQVVMIAITMLIMLFYIIDNEIERISRNKKKKSKSVK
ncbi:MAG: hypothetical protein ACI4C1_07820 [Lachnospiraceae bacterium]